MHQLVPHFILENYAAGVTQGAFPAAGLFVDISGFSTMTDALMAHGQHGAEVLADVMRLALDPLIHAVYAQDGFIATQAGDAFTALFPAVTGGKQAARRALAAAGSIQQAADSRSSHATPYGGFSISAKAGLDWGEVSWGILTSEDERRAVYYFQGPAVDGCAEAEHHAHSGEIILSPSFYRKVQELVSVEPAEDHHRLLNLAAELPAPLPISLPSLDLHLASRFFPADLLTQRHSGEFRQALSLFISLPTVRTEGQLAIFIQTLFELQDRFGGLLKGLDFGDKGANLLLFWGAPKSNENDVDRALSFILELQTLTAIPINGGMTYQVAHAGFIGSQLREEYTIYGRGINLAARFMTAAPRGEIWVDEHIARQVERRYDLEFTGERHFKGFTGPQKVYTLLERKEAAEAFYEGPLVGREGELQKLADFIHPIFAGGSPGMLVVWGEPGQGKSRLVHEFLLRLRDDAKGGIQVFLGQADEILRESLNPFRYWLKAYFAVSETQVEARNKRSFHRKLDELITGLEDAYLAKELDRTRSFIGALVGLHWPDSLYEQLDAEGRHENTFTALAMLLQAESRRGPVVFFLEDAHWLDDDSKEFLSRLIRKLAADESMTYPIALLATSRFAGSGLPLAGIPFQEIVLDRLNREALAALAGSQLGGPAGESLLHLLEERAEGNPFFAEQVLRYLKDEGLLDNQAGAWTVSDRLARPLPADVQAVLVARLDRLALEVKELVQMAAVQGREFDVNLLANMLKDDPSLPGRLDQAEQAAIWFALDEIRYLFRHALLRDAAYGMLLHSRRQALHALALNAIETIFAGRLESQYGELAYHAGQSGQVGKARHYLRLAGQTAQQAYQNSLAMDYYSRAIALTPESDAPALYDLLMALEEVCEPQGKLEDRQRHLSRLEKLADELADPGRKAEVALRQAIYAHDAGNTSEAVVHAERAVALAVSAQKTGIALKAYSIWATAYVRQSKPEAAALPVEKGLALARQTQDRLGECQLLINAGLIAIDQGIFTQARRHFEDSLVISDQMVQPRLQAQALNNLGSVASYQGDYLSARDYYQRALAIARKLGIRFAEGIALGNLGWIAGILGEYNEARLYEEHSLRIAREVGDPYLITQGLINLSSHVGALMDYSAALRYSEEGLSLARETGDQSGEAWLLTYLGHNRFAMGQLQGAAEAYQAAADLRHELEQPLLVTEPQAGLARAALAGGDLPAAYEHIHPIMEYLDAGGSLAGTDQPLRVYLSCYLILREIGDARAHAVLETAHAMLQERLAGIPDAAIRLAFLENIEHNREILAAWQEHLGASLTEGPG